MFKLPNLPYAYDALSPVMSEKTLEFHHGKHHQAYFTKLNELIEGTPWGNMDGQADLEVIIKESHQQNKVAIFNNAAQAYNHIIFWNTLKAGGGGKPTGDLLNKIETTFGSYEDFLKTFKEAGMGQFGSGWVWLSQTSNGDVKVDKYPNGENPLINNEIPLFGVDVWEHAYYLDYQNRRPDYISAIMEKLVNWNAVASYLK